MTTSPRILRFAAALAAAATVAPVQAQPLTGWLRLHANERYEFMVATGSVERAPAVPDSIIAFRILTSRMLVRYVEEGRAELIAKRQAAGAKLAGYDAYASTTEFVDVDCTARRWSLRESTDFDDHGAVLERRRFDRAWRSLRASQDSLPIAAALRWACGQGREGEGGEP